jgi:hypothetical protein
MDDAGGSYLWPFSYISMKKFSIEKRALIDEQRLLVQERDLYKGELDGARRLVERLRKENAQLSAAVADAVSYTQSLEMQRCVGRRMTNQKDHSVQTDASGDERSERDMARWILNDEEMWRDSYAKLLQSFGEYTARFHALDKMASDSEECEELHEELQTAHRSIAEVHSILASQQQGKVSKQDAEVETERIATSTLQQSLDAILDFLMKQQTEPLFAADNHERKMAAVICAFASAPEPPSMSSPLHLGLKAS